VDKGKALYRRGCSACHGRSGEGNRALGGPQLNVANDWYLVTQLKNYISGSRGSHPDDAYGIQMRSAAQLLTDDDAVMAVVSYISTLNDK
jgi:cytochrome c553